MHRSRNSLITALITLALVAAGGCPGTDSLFSDLTRIEVELINDTDFPVDPNIRFDNDSGFLAGLFPAERLGTGLLEPGELVSFLFDCDELGLIFSDEAEQDVPLLGAFVVDATRILERDEEYDCGDLIRFHFVGDAFDFDVVVSVNGRIVD